MKNPLLRFYADNKKYLPGMGIIIFISLLAGVLKMLVSTLWGQAVDFGVAGEIFQMLTSAAAMAGLILLDCSRTALHYHIIGRVTEGMFLEVRTRAFRKLTTGDVAVLEKEFRTGDTATRINNDIDVLSTFAAGHVGNFSRMIFQGVFAIFGCLFLSWQLSIAVCIVMPFSLWIVKKISTPIQKQSKKSMDDTGSAMSVAADTISGILTVKAFGLEEFMTEKFGKDVDAAYEQAVKTEKVGMKMTGVKYVANVMQTMALFLVGSWLVQNGTLTVGTLIAFIALSNYITEPFGQSDYMISQFRRAVATAQRFYEVLDIPDEQPGTVAEPVSDTPCQAKNVAFRYTEEMPVLQGMDLKIEKGKKVAIVGSSGCGKSTLIKLICRFYLLESGSLKLFGVEAKDWNAEFLRQNLAIVTQDSCLFDGSIYENIAYGKPGATREECEAALKEVGLWDFVCQFEDGMDHSIGEYGSQLSGGQKQRLCIARAMVKQAPLVLLDEATSALDTQTEKEVQTALDKLLEGRSAVIVAHRLATVQNTDYIYCMEAGEMLEEGTPSELLTKRGRYYEMCKLQGLTGEVTA